MAVFMSLGAIPAFCTVPGALEAFKRTPTCCRMKCPTPGIVIPDAVCFLVKRVQIVYLRSFNQHCYLVKLAFKEIKGEMLRRALLCKEISIMEKAISETQWITNIN